MRKLIVSILVGFCGIAFAQESVELKEKEVYNRWSFEVNAGQNKPVKPFASGYYSSNPDKYLNFSGVNHFDIGVRYMLSNIFGLKFDYARDQFENQTGTSSLSFSTNQNRFGLQGVVNFGRLMRFETFTSRIGILAHGGLQVSKFTIASGTNNGISEDNGGLILGITPQVRLTKWLALTGDFTIVNNLRQHLNWDGSTAARDENLSGILYNTSLGLTVYLGKKDNHADWYLGSEFQKEDDAAALKRIETIEKQLNDTDRDGVVDYLDTENNTPSGVTVDTKGRFIDANKNGTPDELEARNNKETTTAALAKVASAEKELVESGLVNVFFDVNSDIPNAGSTNNVFTILHYLQENPTAKAKLKGYADVRGDEKRNKDLSQRRAQNVHALLVSSGIATDRIAIEGIGVDIKYTTDSKASLDLARRVSITIEK